MVYPRTLPNKNTPFGRIIAAEIDKSPLLEKAVIIGCCWGDWGQPEPMGIQYAISNQSRLINFSQSANCSTQSSLIFFAPQDTVTEEKIRECYNNKAAIKIMQKEGQNIAKYIIVK